MSIDDERGASDPELYNLPFENTLFRSQIYADIVARFAAGRRLHILEIGVFKGGLIKGMFRWSRDSIDSYTGVDPYLGDENDPYFDTYWRGDGGEAARQYEASKDIFERRGAALVRMTSSDFFATSSALYDVVIIDGDHRFEAALKDLRDGLAALRPGGLLVCDDYGNPDTPDVTRAVTQFVADAGDFYDAAGYRPIWFKNAGRPAPIQTTAIYWRKKAASA